MAVIDVFRQAETQAILNRLKEGEKSSAELNDAIVTASELQISTATFYRRLKELLLANVLEKEGNIYRLTDFGRALYEEFLNTLERQEIVAPKEQRILHSLHESATKSKRELLNSMSGSNTELLERINHLEHSGYIKRTEKKRKKSRGRPSHTYTITEKGKQTIEEVDSLKELAVQDIIKLNRKSKTSKKDEKSNKNNKGEKKNDRN